MLALAFWNSIQQECIAYLLLQSDAPSEEVLSETLEQTKDASALLRRLWTTEKLPDRQFVAAYLSRVSAAKPELFRKLEPLVLEATADLTSEVIRQ